ncbi:hypothetical protein B1756_01630 [Natrarchaeobaculum aegyptiacum]|uniref:Uncharacterized protein n=2 Tax=Natrarchaeobaculum aegyptiacum TaxID=745377 RepID=A0A2Z2HRB9_9EURY|nr:hypothetical protein B1756_01630 [Natrarchaeobaculum aegyptiacum]
MVAVGGSTLTGAAVAGSEERTAASDDPKRERKNHEQPQPEARPERKPRKRKKDRKAEPERKPRRKRKKDRKAEPERKPRRKRKKRTKKTEDEDEPEPERVIETSNIRLEQYDDGTYVETSSVTMDTRESHPESGDPE